MVMNEAHEQGQPAALFDEKAQPGYHVTVTSPAEREGAPGELPRSAVRAWAPYCAFAVYFVGVALRYGFILYWNRATDRENLFSDPYAYFRAAQYFCNPAYVPNITDTIFPPGGGIYFGLLMQFDPTMEWALRLQFLLASLVPLLLFGTASRLYGERNGLFVLAFSSVYFPLWEYFGYLLSEGPFLFFMVLSFYLLIRSLQAGNGVGSALWGFAAGLSLGVSSAFKSIALVSAMLIFLALLAMYWRHKLRLLPTLAASVAGLVLVLAPISVRATRLNEGHFLLIANEAHRSFLLGHHGHMGLATFTDSKRGYFHEFACPVSMQRGYTQELHLNVGVYEGDQQYRMAWDWIKEHPGEAFMQSIEHAFDLFYGSVPWPGVVRPYVVWVNFFCYIFLFFLLVPVGLHVLMHGREALRLDPRFCGDLLLLLTVFSVYLVAFLFVGEPRYRIPYDAFMILLASRVYCGVRPDAPPFVPGLLPAKVP